MNFGFYKEEPVGTLPQVFSFITNYRQFFFLKSITLLTVNSQLSFNSVNCSEFFFNFGTLMFASIQQYGGTKGVFS